MYNVNIYCATCNMFTCNMFFYATSVVYYTFQVTFRLLLQYFFLNWEIKKKQFKNLLLNKSIANHEFRAFNFNII